MFAVSSTAKRLLLGMAGICLIALCVLYFLGSDLQPVLLGLLLGYAISALKIFILEKSINKAVDMDPKQATLYMRVNYILRHFITGGVLLLAILSSYIDFPATVVAVLSMPFSAYFVRLLNKDI